jgi:hypothetical protein
MIFVVKCDCGVVALIEGELGRGGKCALTLSRWIPVWPGMGKVQERQDAWDFC